MSTNTVCVCVCVCVCVSVCVLGITSSLDIIIQSYWLTQSPTVFLFFNLKIPRRKRFLGCKMLFFSSLFLWSSSVECLCFTLLLSSTFLPHPSICLPPLCPFPFSLEYICQWKRHFCNALPLLSSLFSNCFLFFYKNLYLSLFFIYFPAPCFNPPPPHTHTFSPWAGRLWNRSFAWSWSAQL